MKREIEEAVAEHDTSVPPLADFIEDDIGYFNDVDADGDDEEEDDELDVMDELAEHVPKTDRSFQPGHPQHNTHKAHMRREDSSIEIFCPILFLGLIVEIGSTIVVPC